MAEERLPDHIKERVRTLLMEDEWSLRQESFPRTIWAFIAEDLLGRKIVVGQNIDREDQIVIQGGVTLDEITTNRIEQLPEDERNNFLWDLRFELLRTNLEFSGIQLPLKHIDVSERIFLDALTKDTLIQRASEVRKGVLMIQWMLQRKFAEQPSRRQLGFQK
jgi:hypothetical protein